MSTLNENSVSMKMSTLNATLFICRVSNNVSFYCYQRYHDHNHNHICMGRMLFLEHVAHYIKMSSCFYAFVTMLLPHQFSSEVLACLAISRYSTQVIHPFTCRTASGAHASHSGDLI